jgi:hypothetical protein
MQIQLQLQEIQTTTTNTLQLQQIQLQLQLNGLITLRLAIYRQSVRLDDKPLANPDQHIFFD